MLIPVGVVLRLEHFPHPVSPGIWVRSMTQQHSRLKFLPNPVSRLRFIHCAPIIGASVLNKSVYR